MSNDIEVHKRSALVLYRLVETFKRLSLVRPEIGFYGRHREDNIVRMWQYGKKHGK